jgi:tetratricopeptide (TPR) repeat protein
VRCLRALAWLGAGAVCSAAGAADDWSQALVERALPDVLRGDPAALHELMVGANRCADDACRLRLDYTLGYAYERLSDIAVPPDLRAKYERSAADWYEKALRVQPRHVATLDNLARLAQAGGNRTRAIALLAAAAEADPAQRAGYSQRIGDLYRGMGRRAEALAAYEAAAGASADSEAALRRIVELTASEAPGVLMQRAEVWEATHPGVAGLAYEAIMRATYAADTKLAERALVAWLDLLARREAVSPGIVVRLPPEWSSPAVAELRRFLSDPWTFEASDGWWSQLVAESALRPEALSHAGLAMGRDVLARGGGAESAERCWRVALRLAPRDSPSQLDLQAQLATLYHQRPDLDPDGSKTAALIDVLFEGKSAVIVRQDDAATERYHTTLGLILAELGRFGPRSRVDSALFQLEHARDVSQAVQSSSGRLRPLPEIERLLAKGYEVEGLRDDAAQAALRATRAYLDVDDVRRATKMLDDARRLGIALADDHPLAVLSRLRAGLSSRGAPDAALAAQAGAWSAATSADLPADFVDRQRFKLLSDVARARPSDTLAAARALTLAAEKRLPLLSAGDVLRAEAASRIVAEAFGFELGRAGQARDSPSAALQVSLGSTATELALPPQALLAARVAVQADTAWGATKLRLQGKKLILEPHDLSAAEIKLLSDKLKGVQGIESVAVVER